MKQNYLDDLTERLFETADSYLQEKADLTLLAGGIRAARQRIAWLLVQIEADVPLGAAGREKGQLEAEG